MDKNTVTGLLLIVVMIAFWSWFNQPSAEQIKRQQHLQDSIKRAEYVQDSIKKADAAKVAQQAKEAGPLPDSVKARMATSKFGAFAESASGPDEMIVLENNLMKLTVSTHGGQIREAELKKYQKWVHPDSGRIKEKAPLKLLEDKKNAFEYILPVDNAERGEVHTSDLYFRVVQKDNHSVTLQAPAGNGKYFEQRYSLSENSYVVDYDIQFQGLNDVISNRNNGVVRLDWNNYLDQTERYYIDEQRLSTVYFKPSEQKVSYCSCTSGEEKTLGEPVKWVSHAHQFFNSTLITRDAPFASARVGTVMLDPNNKEHDLKLLSSSMYVPYKHNPAEKFPMQMFIGPNDYNTLSSLNIGLQNIISFGWSIFGTINEYIIRPMFNILSSLFSSMGLCILLLTLLVKALTYPLQYKMILSSVKMQVLRPQLTDLKKKLGDDQQRFASEQMKLYQTYGVNPLGGCMPALIQAPIWMALYRFFGASIAFRQESFLWAEDLTSYDSVFYIGGAHISLFTVLWLISMIVFAWYNSKLMDPTASMGNQGNAMMLKYMPYIFPVFFAFALNSSASGLTMYMLFSNLLNIAITLLLKNVIINEDKVRAQLEVNKAQPKKKSKFAQRLEEAMKQQQELKNQRDKNKK